MDNDSLTEREQAVLLELIRGESNKNIAKRLNISLSTVKVHLSSLFYKLQVNNRVSAAVKGFYILFINKNSTLNISKTLEKCVHKSSIQNLINYCKEI